MTREVFRAVPDAQREAAFALGATRWEVTRLAVLKGSMRGIFGAAMLGLGRALGETMAVTMVIGNSSDIPRRFSRPVTRWPAPSPTNSQRRPTTCIAAHSLNWGWSCCWLRL
jgi:phosphate transport system permease protein